MTPDPDSTTVVWHPAGSARTDQEPTVPAAVYSRLYDAASLCVDDPAGWLTSPQSVFGGQTPLDVATEGDDTWLEVENVLNSMVTRAISS